MKRYDWQRCIDRFKLDNPVPKLGSDEHILDKWAYVHCRQMANDFYKLGIVHGLPFVSWEDLASNGAI